MGYFIFALICAAIIINFLIFVLNHIIEFTESKIKLLNESKYKKIIIKIFSILIALIFIDGLNIRTQSAISATFSQTITNFEIYQINVELWVMMFASIIAVLGTYIFTNIENRETISIQHKLEQNQDLRNLKIISLIEYWTFEIIKSDIYLSNYPAMTIDNSEINYLDLSHEKNVINSIFREHNIDYFMDNNILMYRGYRKNDITVKVLIDNNEIIYINPDIFKNIEELNLKNIIKYDIISNIDQVIMNYKPNIVSELKHFCNILKISESISLDSSTDEIVECILQIDDLISTIRNKSTEYFLKFVDDDSLKHFSDFDGFFDTLESLSNIYFLRYGETLSYQKFNSIHNIAVIKDSSLFFPNGNNALIIVNIAKFNNYINFRDENFNIPKNNSN